MFTSSLNRRWFVLVAIFAIALPSQSLLGQEGRLALGENLVVEGIPDIPLSLVAEVGKYTKARSAEILCWHPTKREMLIATFFGTTSQIHQVKFPGGARTQLTFFDDRPTMGVSYPSVDRGCFIFSKDVGGNENHQIYRFDEFTSEISLLTDGQSKNSAGVWSNDGKKVAYCSTLRNGTDTDLYLLDPDRPGSGQILAQLSGGGWKVLDWSPDDRSVLVQEMISVNQSFLWLFDVETGKRTLITPKSDELVSYVDAKYFPDGNRLYVVTDRDSEFQRLGVLDMSSGKWTFLTDKIPWDVFDFKPSPVSNEVAVITNEDGMLRLHLFDGLTGEELELPNLPSGYFTGLCWHCNGKELGFNIDSSKSPTDAYSLDVETGRLDRWTFSETGGLNTSKFVDPEVIHWKSFDDTALSGFLFRPPSRFTGKRPVIIDIHGGPEYQFMPYFMGRQNYFLNELGIALLFPNIRGSSGFGKSFLKLDDGLLRENAYRDIGTLLDWVAQQPDLDSSRIMVTGMSYGGHMALVTAVRYSDRIRCAIDMCGPSNLQVFLTSTAAYRQDLRRVEYGDENDPAIRDFLQQTAPLNNASKIGVPLFVVQGKNDPIVPPSESEQMIEAVRKNGTPVWYLLAKDEGHGFFKKPNHDFLFYATIQFVKTHLLN